jgi:hypothetical protein
VVGDPAGSRSRDGCLELAAAAGAAITVIELPAGGAALVNAGPAPAGVRLRRFAADSFPVEAGRVPAQGSAVLEIPTDRAERPWQLELRSRGEITICGRPPA